MKMKQVAREWVTTLRVEQRHGATCYVVSFSDGITRASLYGSLATTPSEAKRAGWEAPCDWLAHIHPNPRRPRREYRRIYFPVNRQRRKPHGFRRKAAA